MTTDAPQQPIDPRIAHMLDARSLLALLPHVDQSDLHTIRGEFARFIQASRRRETYASWQEAWNGFIGADRGLRHGVIEYRSIRCKDCRHGFSTRRIGHNISRTGQPYVCGTCRGTGRGGLVRQQALPATLPQDADRDGH